jgi:restriction system protein
MNIPKFHETFNPILNILKNGDIFHHRDLLNRVINEYYSSLPKELLEQKTKSGDLLIENRIAWGKSYLKKAGYIHYPERGMVQITPKGKDACQKKLELTDLENESDFLTFYKEEKTGTIDNIIIKSASPQDLIDSGFSQIDTQVKNELLERLKIYRSILF